MPQVTVNADGWYEVEMTDAATGFAGLHTLPPGSLLLSRRASSEPQSDASDTQSTPQPQTFDLPPPPTDDAADNTGGETSVKRKKTDYSADRSNTSATEPLARHRVQAWRQGTRKALQVWSICAFAR
jgi:hypothetical protein